MRFILPQNLRKLYVLSSVRLAAILLSSLFLVNPAWAEPGQSSEKKAQDAAQQNPFGKQAAPAEGDPFGPAPGGKAAPEADENPFRDLPTAVQQDAQPRLHGPHAQSVSKVLRDETKVAFIDTPLEEIAFYLRQLHGINIVLDKAGFEAAQIEVDLPITCNVEGLPLADALDVVFLGTDLHYQDRGTWLLITTEAGINKWIGEQLAKETRISFNQTPMLQALATLSQIHNIPIDVEISTVASHPAFTQGKVTMQHGQITLDKALTHILEEHDLRYERRDRGLWVTGN